MLINLESRVPFTDSFPAPYAKRPEKRWLCTRRSSFCMEKRMAVEALLLVPAPLRTKAVLTVLHRNDPPWPRLDYCSQPTRFPEEHSVARSATITDACMLKVEWTSPRHAMKHGRDRSRKRARTQWTRMVLILKRNLKVETSRGVHWQRWTPPPPPPCVRACTERTAFRHDQCKHSKKSLEVRGQLMRSNQYRSSPASIYMLTVQPLPKVKWLLRGSKNRFGRLTW